MGRRGGGGGGGSGGKAAANPYLTCSCLSCVASMIKELHARDRREARRRGGGTSRLRSRRNHRHFGLSMLCRKYIEQWAIGSPAL